MPKKTALVSAAPATPIRQIDMPMALRQYLESVNAGPLINPEDERATWECALRGLEMTAAGTIIAGYHFKRLRAELPAGEFSGGLAERGVPRSSAYHAIEACELFSAMPEISLVQAFGQLGVMKSLKLGSHLQPEQLTALASGLPVAGLTFDQAAEMSVRDLDAHLKEWKRQHDDELTQLQQKLARTEARAETAEATLDLAQQELANRAKAAPTPSWYRVVRTEAPALSEGMAIHLTDLTRVIQDQVLAAPRKTANEQALARMAAGMCYHALAGVIAQAQLTVSELLEAFGAEALTGEHQVPLLQLDPTELQTFVQLREQMLSEARVQKEAREALRTAEQPRGRGRPKGSKNKAKR